MKSRSLLTFLAAFLVLQSGYLAFTASPDPFYVGNVFLHHYGGLLLSIFVAIAALRALSAARQAKSAGFGTGVLAFLAGIVAVITAIVLEQVHNTRETRWILNLHIVSAIATVLLAILATFIHSRRHPGFGAVVARRLSIGLVLGLAVGGAAYWLDDSDTRYVIDNPERPPLVMENEAMGGAEGPFFPSSASTSTGGRIPSDFFMTSETCQRCHSDIYEQWEQSAHHFSSFNNQWYRKSIEYMQEVNSIQSAKWCAGCHDHAAFFNGMMDDPVSSFINTQEAHTGIACNSCHAITHVKDTMGNGGFFLEYPPLHDMAVSDNPILRWLHDKSVELDPGPHRNVFLKPFHTEQTAELCASCHKVHLDEPVNNYRWLRGFNEYDNWQASGVSGMGARSFYYPPESMDCADCHMPEVASDDKGNIDGYVHDHSFLAANTAVPTANLHEDQLRRTIDFLQAQQVTVDIFAAGPARALEGAGAAQPSGPQLASTFAVGEEAAMAVGTGGLVSHELSPVWGPLDVTPVTVHRGDDVRVDVVVRTRGVGHFFPGGTIDAFDVWLELRAVDDTGRTIFWSGVVEDGGTGPVDERAHFYGARMVDAAGNRIDKRNAFATRAVAWVNLIPPGAADVAHFRLEIPEDCGDEIHLETRLNYRKFSHVNTHFSFAGVPADGEPAVGEDDSRVSRHHDSREFVTGEVPMNVSAALREIPNLPIVVMAAHEATMNVVDAGTDVENSFVIREEDGLRWNDYGIGLMRQGDLSGARRAFEHTVAAKPDYADGFVNLARVSLREGLLDEGAGELEQALALDPDLAKIHYFLGVAAKERGKYDTALKHLRTAAKQYPRDRVVRNDIGRVLFLQRRYEEAVAELQHVLDIDPEDLMAHYNLMLCYKGLGLTEEAEIERKLYERFKADEDANAILGPYLRENPDDNRMRQSIHEQVSVPADMIARELALREENGDPHVVMPGQAREYAARVVERGKALMPELASERILGPTEAGFVDPVRMDGVEETR